MSDPVRLDAPEANHDDESHDRQCPSREPRLFLGGSPGTSPIMPLLLQRLPLLNKHLSVVGNRLWNGVENNPACPGAKQWLRGPAGSPAQWITTLPSRVTIIGKIFILPLMAHRE
jgi:hypothetical protein